MVKGKIRSGNFGLGMRTIKTVISVYICLGIAYFLDYGVPANACITAILTLLPSASESWEYGKGRLIGTGLGGVIGFLFMVALASVPIPWLNIWLFPVAMTVGFVICNFIGRKDACGICAVVILAIMAAMERDESLWYTLARVIETSAGVVIATAVNFGIRPPKRRKNPAQVILAAELATVDVSQDTTEIPAQRPDMEYTAEINTFKEE